MTCPKCAAARPEGSDTCAACGLIFARYDPAALARQRDQRASARAEAGRARGALVLAAAALIAVVLAGIWWSGRVPPQAFAAPTGGGRVFAGLAHGYEGDGADLYLAKGSRTVQAVGRIEAGGRFRFELPASMPLTRLTDMMEMELKNIGPGPSEVHDRVRERHGRWLAEPQSAVHALHAGDGWSELTVEPLELNAARYAVAYGNASEYGDLFAANAEMGLLALPGQAMVVLVYADRPGRVRGVAQSMNAFGAVVPYAWELDLQAGWNLVTSEQAGDMATLRYRTGSLPEDLEWWTIAGR